MTDDKTDTAQKRAAFTEAEWNATHRQQAECTISGFYHIRSGDSAPIAYVCDKINADLIAAAPDMHAALEQCLRHIEVDETTHGRPFAAGNVARAALAKASQP